MFGMIPFRTKVSVEVVGRVTMVPTTAATEDGFGGPGMERTVTVSRKRTLLLFTNMFM
jgi:hypothetical protein